MEKALRVRNILLKTFLLIYVMIFIMWGVSFTNWYYNLFNHFYSMSQYELQTFFLYLISYTKLTGIIFFLFPALAIHWEYCKDKKE